MYCYTIDFSILKNNQTYQEIKFPATGVYKEKGSKFISYSYPVYSKSEICEKIKETKKRKIRQ